MKITRQIDPHPGETMDYFLRRYREQITQRRKAEKEIEDELAQYATQLRQKHSLEPQQVAAD